jgi:hypothetical protein
MLTDLFAAGIPVTEKLIRTVAIHVFLLGRPEYAVSRSGCGSAANGMSWRTALFQRLTLLDGTLQRFVQ